MIGKTILTPRHLAKCITDDVCRYVMFSDGLHYGYRLGVATLQKIEERKVLFIFTMDYGKYYEDVALVHHIKKTELNQITNIGYEHVLTYPINATQFERGLCEMILLPANIKDVINQFAQSNKKIMSSLRSKFAIGTEDKSFIAAYCLSNGSKNFIPWIINQVYSGNCKWSNIHEIMHWNDHYSQLSGKLSKGTITAYTSRQSIYELTTEIRALRQVKRMNDVISSFNTSQKKILKEYTATTSNKHIREAFSKFATLSLTKRKNFIQKMSTIEDAETIIENLKHVVNVLYDWNKKSFMSYLKYTDNLKCEVVIDKDNLVLLKVFDFDTIKRLAKNTNWCISKNKRYWNDYVTNKNAKTIQYMLFDFGKPEDHNHSIVGFTSQENRGITHAHDFTNNDLMRKGCNTPKISTFSPNGISGKNIVSILTHNDISLDTVIKTKQLPFNWNKKDFLEYLYKFISPTNVTILAETETLLCLSILDKNIGYLWSILETSIAELGFSNSELNMVFLDFSLNPTNPESFCASVIGEDEFCECYPMYTGSIQWKNAEISFRRMLIKYNLPYDVIKRIDNPYKQFKEDILEKNIDITVVNKETSQFLKRLANESSHIIYNILFNSLTEYLSLDYLNWIYNNGLTIYDLFEDGVVLHELFNEARRILANYMIYRHKYNFNDDNVKKQFLNKEIRDTEAVKAFVAYLTIDTIVRNETNPDAMRTILDILGHSRNGVYENETYQYFLLNMFDRIDFSKQDDIVPLYTKCVTRFHCKKIQDMMGINNATKSKPEDNIYSYASDIIEAVHF